MKIKTVSEWIDVMDDNVMAGVEQAYIQSIKHKVCVDCLSKENLILKNDRMVIKSTGYYMCKKCCEYWAKKG